MVRFKNFIELDNKVLSYVFTDRYMFRGKGKLLWRLNKQLNEYFWTFINLEIFFS